MMVARFGLRDGAVRIDCDGFVCVGSFRVEPVMVLLGRWQSMG